MATSQLFGRTILAGRDPNEYALTYDDGPNDACTEQSQRPRPPQRPRHLLPHRTLRPRAPDLARRIHAAGHLIGNHTMNHPRLLYSSPSRVREELASTSALLEDATGTPVRYSAAARSAPSRCAARCRDLGLTPVMWNVSSYDWTTTNPETILATIKKGIRRNRARVHGSNLLLHDGSQAGIGQDRSATVAATALLLTQSETARFVTVDAWNGAPER